MAGIIDEIKTLFEYLPKKDRELAIRFLDKRDFLSLKELVDSDVYKAGKKMEKHLMDNIDDAFTEKYVKEEDEFNALKDLQYKVKEQAKIFDPEIDEEYDYDYE